MAPLLASFDKFFGVVWMGLCDERAEKHGSGLSLACRRARLGITVEDAIAAFTTRTAHDVC